MKDLELWHQRLGHYSTRAMIETRKCSKAVSPYQQAFFKYPFYEKVKTMKRSGNKSKDKDVFILGQAYHMDIAFVSGLSNLEEVSTSTNKPKLTMK